MPRTNRIERKRRRANRVQELQRRIDDLEAEVAWLVRVVEEHEDARATGPCTNCSRGVLVHRNGELRCSACGYGRFLRPSAGIERRPASEATPRF